MRPIMFLGIVLIVLGVTALVYQGISYTSRERLFDIGPIHPTADTKKPISVSPILGGLALVGRIVIVVRGIGARK